MRFQPVLGKRKSTGFSRCLGAICCDLLHSYLKIMALTLEVHILTIKPRLYAVYRSVYLLGALYDSNVHFG